MDEELKITGVTFQTGTATTSVRNEGVKPLSISGVRVDNAAKTVLATGGSLTGSGSYDLDPGESGTITIGLSWTSGKKLHLCGDHNPRLQICLPRNSTLIKVRAREGGISSDQGL